MPIYNLIEYSDNYSDTVRSLWQKGNESPVTDAGYPDKVSTNNSLWFKCKSSILEEPDALDANGILTNAKIDVPLKYLKISR